MEAIIVIPARYASSRLPGKPLADINGKPMIQHVYERASQVQEASTVVVATDDQRVYDAVLGFGGRALMTSGSHASGTDRLVEVMRQLSADLYINIQGDEPLIRPADISKLVQMMSTADVDVGTLCHSIDAEESLNPNSVKLVQASNGDVLYFSRSPIPYPREKSFARYSKHVGVYAYRRNVLERYSQLAEPMLEKAESLEQLRLLSAGFRIRVLEVEESGPGVDTPACLNRVRAIMKGGRDSSPSDPLSSIKLVITDVDGVLTDGGIYYDETGECLKRFHVRDGLGIRMLEESGIRVAIVSGRESGTLRKRIQDLGISHSALNVNDKAAACLYLMEQLGVMPEETIFIGDDSIDLPAFEVCGLSATVADAPEYLKHKATYLLSKKGGAGAFREVAELILSAQGRSALYATADGFLSGVKVVAQ